LDNCVYIVTHYGCNSTPSDLWTPRSMLFKDFKEAHTHFLNITPNLNDDYNCAEQDIREFSCDDISKQYVVIEVIS